MYASAAAAAAAAASEEPKVSTGASYRFLHGLLEKKDPELQHSKLEKAVSKTGAIAWVSIERGNKQKWLQQQERGAQGAVEAAMAAAAEAEATTASEGGGAGQGQQDGAAAGGSTVPILQAWK